MPQRQEIHGPSAKRLVAAEPSAARVAFGEVQKKEFFSCTFEAGMLLKVNEGDVGAFFDPTLSIKLNDLHGIGAKLS